MIVVTILASLPCVQIPVVNVLVVHLQLVSVSVFAIACGNAGAVIPCTPDLVKDQSGVCQGLKNNMSSKIFQIFQLPFQLQPAWKESTMRLMKMFFSTSN